VSRGAFTLIETLIAIVLVAVALPVALAGISGAVQVTGQARSRDLARHLAESQLAKLLATGTWSSSAQAGDFDPAVDGAASAGFHWQVAVAPWRDPALDTLRLTVTWDPPSPAHAVALDTLVAPPVAGSAQ
jgi:prepilin-type N-terminal cleavage/methylation domain-containing protein